jgi:hypothetical protein
MYCQWQCIGKEGERFVHRCPKCKQVVRRPTEVCRVKANCGPMAVVPSPEGPGTELRLIMDALGVRPLKNCGCTKFAAWMNEMGVDDCRAAREEIAAKLQAKSVEFGLDTFLTAGLRALTSGIALRINPLHPFLSLVDLAIERASHDLPRRAPQTSQPPA